MGTSNRVDLAFWDNVSPPIMQTLGPWYFADDALHPAGHTHIAPQTGQWTQEMLRGMIDGLRAAADLKKLASVRGPAFVSSWRLPISIPPGSVTR